MSQMVKRRDANASGVALTHCDLKREIKREIPVVNDGLRTAAARLRVVVVAGTLRGNGRRRDDMDGRADVARRRCAHVRAAGRPRRADPRRLAAAATQTTARRR